MLLRRLLLLLVSLTAVAGLAAATPASAGGAFVTGQHRNLFVELLGKSDAEVQAKIDAAWQQFFYGDESSQRLMYPVAGDMAYIADIGNQDVRSEGMSYGMMIAVQLDKRAEFDRLWKWAKTYMHHADGPRRGYFAWQCRFDGTHIDPGSASDGEEWFAMTLLFAANRWAPKPGGIDYAVEAQTLLDGMRRGNRGGEITPIFNIEHKQVVFAPTVRDYGYTDPSYHLPFFYELWARWDRSEEGRSFWAACAKESRTFFHRAAHPKTGLMSEYAQFDGKPVSGERGDFRYDAWRTLAHVALDHAWFASDPWQCEQSNRVLRFLSSQGSFIADRYTLDGKPISTDDSIGLFAMAAVAGLAADPELAKPFVQKLWDAPIPSGRWRYYNGLLYYLGLLQAGGRYQIHAPAAAK
ncbi:MAG: glycoside hydrolase [Verrucomicrobia bacterium]|nr:glycoside hydrolase [Verrucomicrobiota bacterium]